MTTLCFYQGLQTIGGTVLEIATEKTRCLFDFGFVFSPQIDARILPREHKVVSDALRTGTIPMIDGLYDASDVQGLSLVPYGKTDVKPIVLISHMHIDHMGALGLLAEDVEVYMTPESLLLYRGIAKAKDIYHRPHWRSYSVTPMEWIQKEDLFFRMIPVDHDVLGACGFQIRTPDGTLCYTGDLRLHGFEGEKTSLFASLVRGVDLCITEGVTASFVNDFTSIPPCDTVLPDGTEQALQLQIAQEIEQVTGLVFINLYNRNIARLRALHDTLQAIDRIFVIDPETAMLYRQFYPTAPLYIFNPQNKPHGLQNIVTITKAELQEHPQQYVVQLSYTNLLSLLDFATITSLYVHADGAPLGDYDPGFQTLHNFLAKQSIPYVRLSCGGHASPSHLKYILQQIAPKTLIPLHSLKPEIITIEGSTQLLPKPNQRYCFSNGSLEPILP